MCLPQTDLRNEILDHISNNTEAHFKSQQIGDPELTTSEKRNIAESILNKSISLFLTRFGKYLNHEQIELFQNCPEEDEYTVQFYLDQTKKENSKINEKLVRNRRFEAMNQLLEEGSYFSEHEMKSRNPLLYEHLVGQYMTQEEKDLDERVDTSNISFVNLLLHQIDKDNEESFKQEQVETEKMESIVDDDDSPKNSMTQSSSNINHNDIEYDTSDEEEEEDTGNRLERISEQLKLKDNEFDEIQPKSKSLWGEEMSDQPLSKPVGMDRTPWSTSYGSKPSSSQPLTVHQVEEISEKERILLFQEFRSHMMNDFLEGKEKLFDYSKVDSNPAYDNLNDKNQDAQDKYFDEDESSNSEIMQVDSTDHPMSKDNSSDDELDQFMNSLKPEIIMQDINSKIKHM